MTALAPVHELDERPARRSARAIASETLPEAWAVLADGRLPSDADALPGVGLERDARHRYRWNGGPWYPSVTTVLAIKHKPALVGWAKRETAACAVRNLPLLARLAETGGTDAAIDWLKRIPDYRRDTAAELGTRVHALAEALARGDAVAVPDELAGFLDAFRRDFLEAFRPRFLALEQMVCSPRHEYGGTADAFVEIAGELWLLDYKTGAGIYPESALQLAGLARAQFAGRPGDPTPYPVPPATRFGILHLRPERARLVPVRVDRATVAAFLDARRLFGWDQDVAQGVLGEPLMTASLAPPG
jgi:hypothetical protein